MEMVNMFLVGVSEDRVEDCKYLKLHLQFFRQIHFVVRVALKKQQPADRQFH